jgi:hypothetical protein
MSTKTIDTTATDGQTVTATVEEATTYASGYVHTATHTVILPPEAADRIRTDDDLQWEYLGTLSGDGRHGSMEAIYELTVTECAGRPELVGLRAEFQG